MAMKVVRQARLELSGGSTPDQLRPPRATANPSVLSEVLIGHADTLHVRPLLPDLHVA